MTETQINADAIHPHYWKSFGFVCDPFTLAESGNIFIAPAWEEYLDLLPQFVRYCNNLLLLTGQAGVGKSTLTEQFIKEKLIDTETIYIKAAECQGIEYLLNLLHEHYQAPRGTTPGASAVSQLDDQISYLKQHKQSRLLIIDNAEQLPLDMRQACLQIIQQQDPINTFLPIILVGETELIAQFNQLLTSKTAEQCLHPMELAPLDLAQTGSYLKWCCRQAGGKKQEFPFSDEDIETLWQASQGVIGKINLAAAHLLNNRRANSGSKINFSLPQLKQGKLVWWAGVIVAIIALLTLYHYMSRPKDLARTFTKPLTERQAAPANKDYQIGNTVVKNQPAPIAKPATPQTPAPQPAAKAAPIVKATPIKPTAKLVVAAPKIIAAKPKAKPASPLFTKVMDNKLAYQQQRILKMPAKQYTLQLLAATSLESVQKFVLSHKLQGTALIAKTTRNKQTYYLVLYGSFPTAAVAKQSINLLPPALRAQKPWPRSYQSVQEMLHSAHEK